ncbi:hypothetical protein C3433_16485 [Citrobacter freundii]|nr:hypothetical protein C3433_16485 [Citrobacter freundii]
MYLVITKDMILFDSISRIVGPDNTIHICHIEDICLQSHRQSYVIIDTLRNNVFYTEITNRLIEIEPESICIMSPFGIRKCMIGTPVTFVSRTISKEAFQNTVLYGYVNSWRPEIVFTQKQHQVISLVMQRKTDRYIAQEMSISLKTLSIHKYNIMLLLNIRKFSHLLTHRFAVYFCNETTGYLLASSESK